MDRPLLFHGSLALYGLALAANGAFSLQTNGLTAGTVATVLGGLGVFVAAAYGLVRPGETNEVADSWIAYLVAVSALLMVAGLVIGRL
ncbi:MAG: hypothetical protein ABEI77_09690 [Halorientalis sp.]